MGNWRLQWILTASNRRLPPACGSVNPSRHSSISGKKKAAVKLPRQLAFLVLLLFTGKRSKWRATLKGTTLGLKPGFNLKKLRIFE